MGKNLDARALVQRDPAAAALFGLLDESDFGSDFGSDDFGADFGVDFGGDPDYGVDFGVDFGTDAAAQPPQLMNAPTHEQLVSMWQNRQLGVRAQAQRIAHIDPNRYSPTKVERYVMALSQVLTIGTASSVNLESQPDCTFRPNRLTVVVPTPGFVTISDIKMANVSVNIGPGDIDAFQFNANGVGQHMDLPTLQPSNRARISGSYTGFSGGFPTSPAFSYTLSATFIGPAVLAGGASY